MEVLIRLKQTTLVTSYKVHFEVLFARFKGLSEWHKLSYFLSGLKDEIYMNLINLNVAFGLAKIQDEYLLKTMKSWRNGAASAKQVVSKSNWDISKS